MLLSTYRIVPTATEIRPAILWHILVLISLRSKRFRRVWEHRKTEERGSQYFACAENGARAKKRTVSIHRPVILCSRTAQKRLLRRLGFNSILTFT